VRGGPGRRAAAAATVLAALWLLARPAGAEADPVLAESGRRLFLQYCGACHGVDARGDGPVAPVLLETPADLTRIAVRHGGAFPDALVADHIDGRAEVIAHGAREMPVWGRVFDRPIVDGSTGEEVVRGKLWALVEYLESIQVGAP